MTINECIVHSNKNASEFRSAVKQLRREKKFHSDIYQQLPDRCCSCDGKTGLTVIDLNVLRKICDNILLSKAFKIHVPFTKNLNKLILKKRSKLKKKQISKNEIENQLRCQHEDDNEEWNEFEECLNNQGPCNIWEERIEKSYYSKSQLPISSKYFEATVAVNGCIVHDLTYVSEFRRAVQQLRRVSDFPGSIYNQLLKECCSCNGKKGVNVIDPIILRDICYEIGSELSVEQEPETPVDLMSFSFGSTFNALERRRKIGLFVGKNGRHIRAVENKYNVRVNIVTESSSLQLRRNLIEILNFYGMRHAYDANKLYLLLTKMDTTEKKIIPIDEIKQILTEKWNKISNSEHFKK